MSPLTVDDLVAAIAAVLLLVWLVGVPA